MTAPESPAQPDSAPQGDPEPQNPPAPTDEPLREPGKKALDAERARREQAERELSTLRKKIEDEKKSAEQRAADDLAQAREDAAKAHARALRYEVAAAKGIPLELAGRLTGGTREEIEADADVFKGLLPAKPAGPATPPPDPAQGGREQSPASEDDQIYEAIYGPLNRK